MPATMDGAILSKMADRTQIVGGIVDGPLDLDAEEDPAAARIKHIDSPVVGADVLAVCRTSRQYDLRGCQYDIQ